jgi:hypothetical protein
MSALIDLPLRTSYTDGSGNRVTRNLGTAPGAPATCTLGDGVTSTTFPTQVSPHGFLFTKASSQYLRTGLVDVFEWNSPWSFMAWVNPTFVALGVHGTQTLLGSWDIASNNPGIRVAVASTAAGMFSMVSLMNNTGSGQYLQVRSQLGDLPRGASSICVTCDGSGVAAGVRIYENTLLRTLAINSDTLGGRTIKNGKQFLIGAGWTGTTTIDFCGGAIIRPRLYPYVLTPSQVGILHARYMRELQV